MRYLNNSLFARVSEDSEKEENSFSQKMLSLPTIVSCHPPIEKKASLVREIGPDIQRLIFAFLPMRDAITYCQVSKTINTAIGWKTWKKKLEQHLRRRITLDEFQATVPSGGTPLDAARRANITLGSLRTVVEASAYLRDGGKMYYDLRVRIYEDVWSWSLQPISPYLEISFIQQHRETVEYACIPEFLLRHYSRALIKGCTDEEFEDILKLSITHLYHPFSNSEDMRPRSKRWADIPIWGDLGFYIASIHPH